MLCTGVCRTTRHDSRWPARPTATQYRLAWWMVSIWWQWLGALERAAQRARAGEGATFIDCQIFRLHPHMIYSEMAYVDEKELSAAEAAEPLDPKSAPYSSR